MAILAIWASIFTTSVYKGLSKGIKVLSDINVYLIYIILGFVLVFGGAFTFLLQNSIDATGVMFQNFTTMSTHTDPIVASGFAQNWTVFYWAWYLAFAPFMMIFNAKISRGENNKTVPAWDIDSGQRWNRRIFSCVRELHDPLAVKRYIGYRENIDRTRYGNDSN